MCHDVVLQWGPAVPFQNNYGLISSSQSDRHFEEAALFLSPSNSIAFPSKNMNVTLRHSQH